MFTKALVLSVSCSALMFGCAAEPQDSAGDTQEIIDNLQQAGFPKTDIQIFDGKVYVGLDAEVSLAASREMLQAPAGLEQFRTTNLVGTGVTNICVNGSAFTGNFSTALNNAIANYNAQPIRFRLTRTTGSTAGCSATITGRLVGGGAGGSSGFPSGGLPFNTINIASATGSFSTAVIEHVITHEIGHTIGFRHSDFFNRSISCGGAATNEGNGGVGAILIPGTPSGATLGGSLMNSCFRSTENGNFSSTDITALNALY